MLLILPHHTFSCMGLDLQEMPAHLKPVQPAVPESCGPLCARVHAVRTKQPQSSEQAASSPHRPPPPVSHTNPISSLPSEWVQAQRPPGGMLVLGGLLHQPGSLTHPSQSGAIASPSTVPASPADSPLPRSIWHARF